MKPRVLGCFDRVFQEDLFVIRHKQWKLGVPVLYLTVKATRNNLAYIVVVGIWMLAYSVLLRILR